MYLTVGSNYIPDPCDPEFLSDIELCFDMFLSLFENLLENCLYQNSVLCFSLKKKSYDPPKSRLKCLWISENMKNWDVVFLHNPPFSAITLCIL